MRGRRSYSSFSARTSSAASKSPLASPAINMKVFGLTRSQIPLGERCSWGRSQCRRLDLARDFEGEIERAFGGLAADDWFPPGFHTLDEMLELELERLFLRDGHRLTD